MVAKVGFGTGENGPLKVCQKLAKSSNKSWNQHRLLVPCCAQTLGAGAIHGCVDEVLLVGHDGEATSGPEAAWGKSMHRLCDKHVPIVVYLTAGGRGEGGMFFLQSLILVQISMNEFLIRKSSVWR